MSEKGSNFFEKHIEKAVLGLVGVVCLWLLVTKVIMSPNFVEYDNSKFSAGKIDDYINRQAETLENKMGQKPKAGAEYKPRIEEFAAKFDSSLGHIDVNAFLPQPGVADVQDEHNRVFAIPQVGKIEGAEAEHIRAVVFVPTRTVNEEHPYQSSEVEPNNADIVTVEAKFDAAGLYERFYANFAGENVRDEQWRDPCLAVPVFAAVQLQRQELLADGSWSQWDVVPRTKIDSRAKMFEIVEDVKKLSAGGVKIRLLQFNDPILRKQLLQPESYKIASSGEEWFPPSLHKEFLKNQQSVKAQAKHDAAKMKSKEEGGTGTRPERPKNPEAHPRPQKPVKEGSGTGAGAEAAKKAAAKKPRPEHSGEKETPEKSKETAKAPTDVRSKFNAMLLTPTADLSHMSAPLNFWAVDDTVIAGKTYRYRIRLGVFNPIAGTNQFREEDKNLRDSVILWSDFSDITKNVEVPASLYFFPREIQEVSGTVTIQVSKYVLGNWYSKDFPIKRGESIGKVARTEVTGDNLGVVVPEAINYDTGAVLVDIVPVNDWSGAKGLHPRSYFDMLYSFDGTKIEHMPIKIKNWDDKIQARFNEIKRAEKEPKVTLRDWSGATIMATEKAGSKTSSGE